MVNRDSFFTSSGTSPTQQRKPPAKRLFTGMAGSPLSKVTPPDQPPVVPPAPSKRGRPPKHGVAMSNAERKRRERASIERDRTAPEREELIKKIKKRIRTSEHADITAMKRALAQFSDMLDQKSMDDLRDIAKAYRIHDQTGRDSLEGHTGGKDIEKIDAAAQRDENGRRPRTGMTAERFADTPFINPLNKKKKAPPKGIAKWDIPLDHVTPSGSCLQMRDIVKTVWDYIPEITETMFDGEERDFSAEYDPDAVPDLTLQCRVLGCTFRTASWFDARKHVEETLKKAEQQLKFIEQLTEVVDAGTPGYDSALVDARKVFSEQYWPHHAWVRRKWEDFRDRPIES